MRRIQTSYLRHYEGPSDSNVLVLVTTASSTSILFCLVVPSTLTSLVMEDASRAEAANYEQSNQHDGSSTPQLTRLNMILQSQQPSFHICLAF